MESGGTARITSCLCKTGKVVIGEHVSDDDSCGTLTKNWWMQEDDVKWPCYKGTNKAKKPDNGLLPVDHPPINFKAKKGQQ
jgi:hypothetical protein